MKIVILGGGVAGLAFGIIMQKKGHEIIINEKGNSIPYGGNAFMMHEEGINVLKDILENEAAVPGITINQFLLKYPDDNVVTSTSMDSWRCMKRRDLIDSLLHAFNHSNIKYNRNFSHFIYEGSNAVAAVFENGEVEIGDVFIGADGCNSQVRQLLFGETEFTKVEVQEILGVVKNKKLASSLQGVFTKYQHPEKGISFGCIPFSSDEIIWFSQVDVNLIDRPLTTKKDIADFTKEALKDFPEQVQNILKETDFTDSYLWNTKDFDALQTFHSGNIVLIGDAAHISLPFTSAGTTNALIDARQLAFEIEDKASLQKAFVSYYSERIHAIKEHIQLGRKLKYSFLNPKSKTNQEIEIPLIKTVVNSVEKEIVNNKVEIVYFTDPICSTCWTIQPQLRKLKLSYAEHINFKYVMGGLLPSWENFNRGGITKPSDVAEHWNEVSLESGMPLHADIWINDPLHSSYPPSIAFKAAQLQHEEKSVLFLRRLNEFVFLEGKNIANIDMIINAAKQTGINIPKLLFDMKHKAGKLFNEDLEYTKSAGVSMLPTFIIKVNDVEKETLQGIQTFESFESSILKYAPYIPKSPPMQTAMDVFKKYPSVTITEFSYLTNSNHQQSKKTLNDLIKFGMIVKHETKAGSVFLSKSKIRTFVVY